MCLREANAVMDEGHQYGPCSVMLTETHASTNLYPCFPCVLAFLPLYPPRSLWTLLKLSDSSFYIKAQFSPESICTGATCLQKGSHSSFDPLTYLKVVFQVMYVCKAATALGVELMAITFRLQDHGS